MGTIAKTSRIGKTKPESEETMVACRAQIFMNRESCVPDPFSAKQELQGQTYQEFR